MKNVTVFGGSQCLPGEAAYEQARYLGQKLGEAGFTVLSGGYMGTMEAVSRGAAEAGGHVIGVTCDEIERWRPVSHNAWVQEEWRLPTLRERLFKLLDSGDAALALPGGVGTLAEVAMMWTNLVTGGLSPRPLVLIGPEWHTIINSFLNQFDRYIPNSQRHWLVFAPDVEQAVTVLVNMS